MSKKSFVLYKDQKATFDSLTDEQAGVMIKSIFDYAEGNDPKLEGLMIPLFTTFKITLDRDLAKWEQTCLNRSVAGRKGGEAKARNSHQKVANATDAKREVANLAENVIESESVIENDSVKEAYDYYNLKRCNMKKATKLSTQRKASIRSRIKENSLDDVMTVIDNASSSPFLQGETDAGFSCGFDWIMGPKNFIKVLEGNYAEKRKSSTDQSSCVTSPINMENV